MWMNPLCAHPAHLSSHTAAALIFIHMGRYSSESWPRSSTDGEENRGKEEDEGGTAGGGVYVVNRLVEMVGLVLDVGPCMTRSWRRTLSMFSEAASPSSSSSPPSSALWAAAVQQALHCFSRQLDNYK